MTDSGEVIVLNPSYWADRPVQLAELLGRGTFNPIGDPSGETPDPETVLTVVDPGYWASQSRELEEVLKVASGRLAEQGQEAGGLAPGAASGGEGRLTLSVEEAAIALGISRAFAYESVRRGDIPHIKIGRRLLVPKKALERLLASAMPENPDDETPDA